MVAACGSSGSALPASMSPDVPRATPCTAGLTVACPCSGGGQGVQTCDSTSGAFGSCVCAVADSGSDATVVDSAADTTVVDASMVERGLDTVAPETSVSDLGFVSEFGDDGGGDTGVTTTLDGCSAATTSDPANCGLCGHICASPSHASPVCTAGVCGFVCSFGSGDCDADPSNGCETDLATSLLNCGTCGRSCPARLNASADCRSSACSYACSSGFHACGETCVPSTSVLACGTSCIPCTPPANATATCDGLTCNFACAAGYHRCGPACILDSSASACGLACLSCASPVNGVATCISGSCGFTCSAGFHACGGICATDSSLFTCGSRCDACPTPPPNSVATCDGIACGFRCNAGFHACGASCADNGAIGTCGSLCEPCVSPTAHGIATCDATSCGITCDAGYTRNGTDCDIASPRLIAPMSSSTVTSRRPTLRIALASSTDGARIDICRDRACSVVFASLDAVGSTATPTADLPRGVLFWRAHGRIGTSFGAAASVTWEFTVGALSAPVSTSWGNALHDVNGDGYSDVIVGASCAPTVGLACGAGSVYVYHGTPTGLPAAASTVLVSPDAPGSYFGWGAASAGDVNGDGFADVVVTAYQGGLRGIVRMFMGSVSGVSHSSDLTFTVSDATHLGNSVAGAGDVNGDGFADIVVGDRDWGTGSGRTGRAHVFLGSPSGIITTPATTLVGPDGLGGRFGEYVASAGDVNGDGYSDVIIAAPLALNVGRVYIYLGGSGGLAAAPVAMLARTGSNLFGNGVASAGDVNRDGYSDVIVYGGDGASPSNAVFVYHGGPSGVPALRTMFGGVSGGPSLAGPVAEAGDVDGDGFGDVLLGPPAGTIVFRGGSSGLDPTRPTVLSSGGESVQGVGDVNGDGYADVAVGSQYGPYPGPNGPGEFFLHFGGVSGTAPLPGATRTGPDGGNGYFGRPVAARVELRRGSVLALSLLPGAAYSTPGRWPL